MYNCTLNRQRYNCDLDSRKISRIDEDSKISKNIPRSYESEDGGKKKQKI